MSCYLSTDQQRHMLIVLMSSQVYLAESHKRRPTAPAIDKQWQLQIRETQEEDEEWGGWDGGQTREQGERRAKRRWVRPYYEKESKLSSNRDRQRLVRTTLPLLTTTTQCTIACIIYLCFYWFLVLFILFWSYSCLATILLHITHILYLWRSYCLHMTNVFNVFLDFLPPSVYTTDFLYIKFVILVCN